mmetsp:Transcript_34655/g.48041  ORF Transcript_34655/g.48041 Transcript_34655/m.48041 type:complete len:302 (+) Transcript_34655:81-986(+)|eukprot:CAMPEP_0196587348 /NCGR_PEP_ID=MMETSP1081-20130531/57212_1 /TAXON_ID=36882 /ORGANISM="Pyramimonas amylifera, Strain CCMP720" /LENGTH=301 /DNA_ID=CAMNT_0041909519 /DNA_START=63 /DNA_END=968 /DNA_ORIENTATION=+
MYTTISIRARAVPATSQSRSQSSRLGLCATAPRAAASHHCSFTTTRSLKIQALRARNVSSRSIVQVSAEAQSEVGEFEPILKLEELPKGSREIRETSNGKSVLFFWYRNEICAIESRSPAEGAYSFGFLTSRLTQEGGVECPGTGTVFNLKSGEIMEWYPDNVVLRALTPQDTCRPMEVFPVKVTAEAIMVDPVNTNLLGEYDTSSATTLGGANSSLENNNVFAIEPQTYYESGEKLDDSSGAVGKIDPSTLVVSVLAVGVTAVAGTATCLFYENLIALGVFWIIGFGATAYAIYQFQEEK